MVKRLTKSKKTKERTPELAAHHAFLSQKKACSLTLKVQKASYRSYTLNRHPLEDPWPFSLITDIAMLFECFWERRFAPVADSSRASPRPKWWT